jgi:NitT/TauT family transport system substrate-binding protein
MRRASGNVMAMRRSTFVLSAAAFAVVPSVARAQTLAPIRISLFPGETAAQIYYAKELGFFAKNGLDATVIEVRNGAASAAAVAGGSVDVGFSNGLSLAQGHERGVGFTILAPAAISVAGKGTNAILVVGKTSPIRTGKDLNGKTIAIDVVGGFPQIAVRTWIDKNGGDSSTAKFIEFGYPEMIPGVNTGRIDAAAINTAFDPLLGKPNDPVHMLGSAYDAVSPRFASSIWFSMLDWAQKNPDVVRRFDATMKQAAMWGNTHPHESAEIVAAHIKQSATDIEAANRAIYGTEMTPDLLQPVIDASAKYGSLKTAFPARDLIFTPPKA